MFRILCQLTMIKTKTKLLSISGLLYSTRAVPFEQLSRLSRSGQNINNKLNFVWVSYAYWEMTVSWPTLLLTIKNICTLSHDVNRTNILYNTKMGVINVQSCNLLNWNRIGWVIISSHIQSLHIPLPIYSNTCLIKLEGIPDLGRGLAEVIRPVQSTAF